MQAGLDGQWCSFDDVWGGTPATAFRFDVLIPWAVVLLAAAVAIDVGVRTGDVGGGAQGGGAHVRVGGGHGGGRVTLGWVCWRRM
ncbi:MAG: hypothetical protein KatS3mg077_2888 [Candidatus Binatia bacterium]|nr:MAG: hypothetical protein KatS3mg077_2888 [Candidatus Binatia bacterium]